MPRFNIDCLYFVLFSMLFYYKPLKAMDCFVFPSLFEGLGIVLIEAQKMKKPCFISENIPKAAIISNLVNIISLSKMPKEWADIILKYKLPSKIVIDDKEWNIVDIVKKLQQIYLS